MTHPTCPTCRFPIRPRHELVLAMRAVAIPVRDAHEKLNQPARQRVEGSQWALGRLDEAKVVAEAHEGSCACVEPAPSTTCPCDYVLNRSGALVRVSTDPACLVHGATVLNSPLLSGDGFTIAPARPSDIPDPPETLRDAVASQSGE